MSFAATVVALFAFRYKSHPKLVEACYGVPSELSATRGLNSGDIDFLHRHHRVKCTFGFIAAGSPIEPYTDPGATYSISPTMLSGKRRAYVLKVKGQSMVDDGIMDGDYVVVEEQDEVKNGDIVVALLENGLATLKRFYREATRVRLEPANTQMAPIYATRVRIQGKVVGVIRAF